MNTTVIVNNTSDVLKVQVGGHQYNAEVASIDKGGQWNLHVNVNETYREFRLQDSTGTRVEIVTTDDCCDCKCITIKEAGDESIRGKFDVHRVLRLQQNQNHGSQLLHLPPATSPSKNQNSSKLSWFGWLRQMWAQR